MNSETLWAEHGLTGLVLSALFGLIVLFLRATSRKDHSHQSFIEKLIQEERTERRLARRESAETHSKLSDAIDGLAGEIRRSNNQPDEIKEGIRN